MTRPRSSASIDLAVWPVEATTPDLLVGPVESPPASGPVKAARPGTAQSRKRPNPAPTLKVERGFLAPGVRLLAGVDEVGRGALAGPVSVGIAVVDLERQRPLKGVRDSKLLKPEDRERLEPLVRAWAVASAVGHATSQEIDQLGLTSALRLAGSRAWSQVLNAGVVPDIVLLDGSHNWLSPAAQGSLFDDAPLADLGPDSDDAASGFEPSSPFDGWTALGGSAFDGGSPFGDKGILAGGDALRGGAVLDPGPDPAPVLDCDAPVHTRVKADLSCLSVAAASVLAKVARDRMMKEFHREYPTFCWDENKGYATPAHREALRTAGPSPYHRISWNILY